MVLVDVGFYVSCQKVLTADDIGADESIDFGFEIHGDIEGLSRYLPATWGRNSSQRRLLKGRNARGCILLEFRARSHFSIKNSD